MKLRVTVHEASERRTKAKINERSPETLMFFGTLGEADL